MKSNEQKSEELYEENQDAFKKERLSIPSLKYFWQASPLGGNKEDNIPKFLRSTKVFAHFTDYELKVFSNFIHQRSFSNDEVIIKEGDLGFGFYIVFNGHIEVYAKKNKVEDNVTSTYEQFVVRLSKSEYFGELALLDQQNRRNATAISKGNSSLFVIYKPDIEELIERYPVLGAKFLQSVALIVAMRFNRVTSEYKMLKERISDLERKLDSKEN